jgi:predicted PurR-regulated permease PerM
VPQTPTSIRLTGAWVSLLALVLIVGILWAAKTVLLPLALGIVLAFTLTPIVRGFDRLHLPRFAGVLLTIAIALGATGGVGYVVFDQFTDLSTQVTKYTSSMRKKVAELRLGNDTAFRQFTRTVDRVTEQLDENADDLRRALPVKVIPPRVSPLERFTDVAASVFEPFASTVLVLVLVAFMLAQREDLRDRFIRLSGAHNVTQTTRLLDEAGHRVSRFLVAQTLVNIVFGTIVAGGLYWIGVPYAALWGGLTAVLRFVPFVGTLLSALMPAMLAFAIFPGWSETLQTLLLYLILDGCTAYFVEPVLFGNRTGVSAFALMVSALFWIWVWGPVGLLLSTPLTVVIAVIGRNVRSLRFLAVIFAEEPALMPHVRFYQRLLARDENEASVLVERKLAEMGPVGVMDQILVPAMVMAVEHEQTNEITEEDVTFITEATSEFVQQMHPIVPHPAVARVVGLSSRTSVDHLILQMLAAASGGASEAVVVLAEDLSVDEAVTDTIQKHPALVCIVSISPSRGSEVRNFCRRIRSALPDTKLLVLRPGRVDAEIAHAVTRLQQAGADRVVVGIKDALDAMEEMLGGKKPAAIDTAALASTSHRASRQLAAST